MRRSSALRKLVPGTLAATALASCAQIAGFPEYTASGAGGTGGGSGTGGTTTTSTTMATTTTTTTTGAGAGDAGSDGGPVCTAGVASACYDGPDGTLGVGTCKGGTHTCAADGMGYGACTGEVTPRTENCSTPAIDESCDGLAECTGALRWARSFGGAGAQQATGVAVGADGSVYVVGSVQGSADFGGGSTSPGSDAGVPDDDGFVAAYGPLGQFRWSRRFGDGGKQDALEVAVDPTNGDVLVVGSAAGVVDFGDGQPLTFAAGDGFAIRYDPAGDVVWKLPIGGAAGGFVEAVVVGPQGETYLGGQYKGSLVLTGCAAAPAAGAGSDNAFVARLDATGACTWVRGFGSNLYTNQVTALALGAGVLVATGTYAGGAPAGGSVDFGGGNTLAVAGSTDGFVIRLDPVAGTTSWVSGVTGVGNQTPVAVSVDQATQDIVAFGRMTGDSASGANTLAGIGGVDAFYVRLKSTGAYVGSYVWGNGGTDDGQAVAFDGLGDVTVAITTNSASLTVGEALSTAGGNDAFVVKFQPAGQLAWARQIADPNSQNVTSLATDAVGGVVVAGVQNGTVDLQGYVLQSSGANTVFVASFAP